MDQAVGTGRDFIKDKQAVLTEAVEAERATMHRERKGNEMSTIVIVVLVLLLVGVLPTWPHSANWGYFPSGGLGLILLVLVSWL